MESQLDKQSQKLEQLYANKQVLLGRMMTYLMHAVRLRIVDCNGVPVTEILK